MKSQITESKQYIKIFELMLYIINNRIKDEENALRADDPDSVHASSHRGAIRAYKDCINLINQYL